MDATEGAVEMYDARTAAMGFLGAAAEALMCVGATDGVRVGVLE